MPNTIQRRTLVGSGSDKIIWLHIHITSDGSEETNLIAYDNSAFVNNVLKGNLMSITAMGSSCTLVFKWDQTADSYVCAVDPINSPCRSFKTYGGIGNPGAAGATGDLLLSTAGLDAGDEVTIILEIYQN